MPWTWIKAEHISFNKLMRQRLDSKTGEATGIHRTGHTCAGWDYLGLTRERPLHARRLNRHTIWGVLGVTAALTQPGHWEFLNSSFTCDASRWDTSIQGLKGKCRLNKCTDGESHKEEKLKLLKKRTKYKLYNWKWSLLKWKFHQIRLSSDSRRVSKRKDRSIEIINLKNKEMEEK